MQTIDPSMAYESSEEIYSEMVSLLKRIAPKVEPLGTCLGVLSQLDNWCAGHIEGKKRLADITPLHEPVLLLNDALEKCKTRDVIVAYVALMDRSGGMWHDSCGESQRELYWALGREQYRLMVDDDDD